MRHSLFVFRANSVPNLGGEFGGPPNLILIHILLTTIIIRCFFCILRTPRGVKLTLNQYDMFMDKNVSLQYVLMSVFLYVVCSGEF